MILNRSRTSNVRALEPLTPLQERSALLAPIATECSVCESMWYSIHTLLPGKELVTTNPMGLQCQDCRYTLCRNCREWSQLVDLRRPCPAPGCQGTLTTPVLPTGRRDVSPIDPGSVDRVIVVREGAITPTMDEALTVVAKFVPLLPDDAPLIRICPGIRGMMNDEFTRNRFSLSLVQGLERDGVLAPEAWKRAKPLFIRAIAANDTDYLLTVVRKPGSTYSKQPLIHVHVMREGSHHIDPDCMTTFLQLMAPEAFEDSPTIHSVGVRSWRDDPQGLAMASVAAYNNEYLSDAYDMHVLDGRDQDGIRWAIVKVFAKMPKHADADYPSDASSNSGKFHTAKVSPWRRLWRRITAVRRPDSTPSPDWYNYVASLVNKHVRHMASQIPATAAGECWSGLRGDEMITATAELLHQGLLAVRRTHDLTTTTRAVAKYTIAATVIPTSNIGKARDQFVGGYLAYLEELVNRHCHTVGNRISQNFVHWIMSSDGTRAKLDATVLPADDTEEASVAVDLLTPDERQRLGL